MHRVVIVFALFLCLYSCDQQSQELVEEDYVLNLPTGFTPPPIPEDNPLSSAKIALGKRLFEDVILSSDSSISCRSCHLPQLAFTDGQRLSVGVEGRIGKRNTPTLTNLAWMPYFFMEGGSPTLELQMLGPIEEHHEMNLPFPLAVERIQNHPEYPKLFQEVFGKGPTSFTLTRAIAAYERTLISGNSHYDLYMYGGDSTVFSSSEKRGLALFNSEALHCNQCHSGFLLADYSLQNNGIYELYEDEGRKRITGLKEDIGKFKVPTLRNIELTAPYMHDGSLASLEEVIEHYASGGKNHPNQSKFIRGFNISAEEKSDLISFLKALTDHKFCTNN